MRKSIVSTLIAETFSTVFGNEETATAGVAELRGFVRAEATAVADIDARLVQRLEKYENAEGVTSTGWDTAHLHNLLWMLAIYRSPFYDMAVKFLRDKTHFVVRTLRVEKDNEGVLSAKDSKIDKAFTPFFSQLTPEEKIAAEYLSLPHFIGAEIRVKTITPQDGEPRRETDEEFATRLAGADFNDAQRTKFARRDFYRAFLRNEDQYCDAYPQFLPEMESFADRNAKGEEITSWREVKDAEGKVVMAETNADTYQFGKSIRAYYDCEKLAVGARRKAKLAKAKKEKETETVIALDDVVSQLAGVTSLPQALRDQLADVIRQAAINPNLIVKTYDPEHLAEQLAADLGEAVRISEGAVFTMPHDPQTGKTRIPEMIGEVVNGVARLFTPEELQERANREGAEDEAQQ